jgi:hypothetical protein
VQIEMRQEDGGGGGSSGGLAGKARGMQVL